LKNLSSGDHRLYLRAGYQLGNTTEARIIDFTKLAPVYLRMWFIVLMLLTFILGTIGVSRYQINRNKLIAQNELALQQKIIYLEQKALGVAMKPHFVFNVLNSISSFLNQNKLNDVNNYLSKFASLIRKNFEVMGEDLVSLDDELERLILYLDLELLRFESKFSYEIIYDKESDFEALLIPSLIFQPFVENAIWHGRLDKINGKITVEIVEADPYLHIIINDNGIGIDTSLANKKKTAHESKGILITKERIRLLGLNYNLNSNVSIKQTKPQGTSVKIQLPMIEKS